MILGDDPIASRVLRRTLEQADAVVVGEAPLGRAGLELARHHVPDVALVDFAPGAGDDGVAVVESLIAMGLGIRPVAVASEPSPDAGLAAIRAGARGFLSPAALAVERVPRLLAAAMGDELVCSRSMLTSIVERLLRSPPPIGAGFRPVRSPLTSREWEILDLLCAGHATDRIAEELVISTETVRTHLKNLMRKLGATSRADVIASAPALRAGRSS